MALAWRAGSLRHRLLAATLVSLAVALWAAHWRLSALFADHVMRQFDVTLVQQLDQLTARLEFDDQGQPVLDARSLSDPRWAKPYSGLYWQIDRAGADDPHAPAGPGQPAVLRSRSLWDVQLRLPADTLADGQVHQHQVPGPQGHVLRVVERSLQAAPSPARWRLVVAADPQEAQAASERLQGVLAASLAALGLLMALAALAQAAVVLAPLQALQRALVQVREGRAQRLQGRFPSEVQPLIDDFNGVLTRQEDMLARARTQAGNLAHALKTPLAVLGNMARQPVSPELARLVSEQVQLAEQHIQWHLSRARAAAAAQLPGQRTPLKPALEGVLRLMHKIHVERRLALSLAELPADCAFAGEAQDLQEMLGNLLDNACRSARHTVRVAGHCEGGWLHLAIDDDGPGIAPEQRQAVLQRGVRLDETLPGSGLGLAIVVELAALYGGTLVLQTSGLGGLSAHLSLPAAV